MSIQGKFHATRKKKRVRDENEARENNTTEGIYLKEMFSMKFLKMKN